MDSGAAAASAPAFEHRIDVVLEGGGVKGIALVGALEVLEERGYHVNRIAGSSAGAIAGTLVAAGIPARTMAEILRGVDYRRFRDGPFWLRFLPGKALSILLHNGIYLGKYLTEWLETQLREFDTTFVTGTFSDVPYRDPDPERIIPPHQRFRLVVTASDLSHRRLRLLPWDYPLLGRDPAQQRIVDAVRASMSIPFFYRPVIWKDAGGRKLLLVDGGMLSNFPITLFDANPGVVPRWPTFGIKLSSPAGSRLNTEDRITGPLTLAIAMLRTMMGFYDGMHVDSADARARTIFIDTGEVRTTEFDLSEAQREMLFAQGRRAAIDFLDGTATRPGWDFERYIAQHRSA